jgi:hypothetical protein
MSNPTIDKPDGVSEPGHLQFDAIRFGAWPNQRHRHDSINWPYPSANTQYWFMNAWYGNQLPGFHKRPWEEGNMSIDYVATSQNGTAHYPHGSSYGIQVTQPEMQSMIKQVAKKWQDFRG